MLIEQLKKRAVNEDYVSSDEESDFKSYTLVIVSTMTEHEKIYQTWQNNEANLARQKRIMLDQVVQKPTEYGTGFVVTNSIVKKLTPTKMQKDFGSFGNLHQLEKEKEDGSPQIRAVYPLSKKTPQNLIGKIIFYKDSDVLTHPFEKHAGKWAAFFNAKLAQYCVNQPRYSELRPLKYAPDFE